MHFHFLSVYTAALLNISASRSRSCLFEIVLVTDLLRPLLAVETSPAQTGFSLPRTARLASSDNVATANSHSETS